MNAKSKGKRYGKAIWIVLALMVTGPRVRLQQSNKIQTILMQLMFRAWNEKKARVKFDGRIRIGSEHAAARMTYGDVKEWADVIQQHCKSADGSIRIGSEK